MPDKLEPWQSMFMESIKDHKAETRTVFGKDQPNPQVMVFRHPDHSTYRMDFVLWGQTLFVTGDVGEAAYCWNQLLTWEFLKQCDFGYFLSKCRASENGIPAYGRFNSKKFCRMWMHYQAIQIALTQLGLGDVKP